MNTNEEQSNIVVHSPLWHHIYAIIRQIPRDNVDYDAMDAPSAATQIEDLFNQSQNNINGYIKYLKTRIKHIQDHIPEFWMHENLNEIQVLYRTINELKTLYNITTENDDDMNEIKEWLKGYSRSV